MITYGNKVQETNYSDHEFVALRCAPSEHPEIGSGSRFAGDSMTTEPSEKKILVVNDNLDQLELMSVLLNKSGYKILRAFDGQEGFQVAQAEHPHLVISDVLMPRLDGIEMCRLIRQHSELRTIPVLLVSANRKDSDSVAAGLKAGAEDYLEAPYHPMRLITKVAQLIERQRANMALRESEAKYRELVENINDVIFAVDEKGLLTYVSPAIESVAGYSPSQLLGRSFTEFIFPEDLPDVLNNFRKVLAWQPEPLEYRIQTKTGKTIWVRTSSRPIGGGNAAGLRGVMTDITGRKRAEEALRASEEELRRLFGAMTDVILVLDAEGRYLKIAPTDPSYLYRPPAELVGKTLHEVFPKKDADFFLEHIHRALDEGRGHRVEYRLQIDETEIWFDAGVSPVSKDSVVWIARDITERKRAEERLQESERRFRQLAENINEVFWLVDPNEREMLYVSPAYEEIWGRTCASLYEQIDSFLEAVHPEDQEQILAAVERQTWGEHTDEEYRIVRPDGSIRWIHDRAFPIKDEYGRVGRIVGIAENITERKRAEEALRQSEQRYRLLFDSNPQPMWVVDLETLAFLEVNQAAIRHYGYSREESLSMTIKDICLVEDGPALLEYFTRGAGRHEEARFWWHRKEDGTIIEVEITAHDLIFYNRPARIILAYDVTERRSLEEQLRQSQKLEAIGQLAGGIAHDFNNLLTAICGYSDLTINGLKREDPLRQNVEEIKKAGARAASLTRQLLAFSRKQVMQPRVIEVNTLITNTSQMLRRLVGEHIEFITLLRPEAGRINADPGQIEQVIMNLVVNARDAMPQGGKLIVETGNQYLDDQYATHHVGVKPGQYVSLAVSDTGTGMDQETQARIFVPFFTTKEPGKGTGLGLSTAYGIVKQSAGNIWVYSEVGKGTTFKVYLPRVVEDSQEYKQSTEPERAAHGTETILLVEDDERVRNLVHEVLENYGYQVLEAANGIAALSICERYSETIHLLVTDVVMPEMSGRDLADRLAQVRLGMKVLYMSGYTDDVIVHHRVLDEGTQFIQKPFTPNDLAHKVRDVLDAPANR